MHECPDCAQACDCDGCDVWNDAASRVCAHGCEDEHECPDCGFPSIDCRCPELDDNANVCDGCFGGIDLDHPTTCSACLFERATGRNYEASVVDGSLRRYRLGLPLDGGSLDTTSNETATDAGQGVRSSTPTIS